MKKLKRNSVIAVLNLFVAGLVMSGASVAIAGTGTPDQAPGRTMAQQATKDSRLWITTDHSKLAGLDRVFASGQEVTAACVSCHSEAATQFRKTIHWTWLGSRDGDGKRFGKGGDSINNFCISTNNMQDKSCLDCHPGWGLETDAINCLACHGQEDINWDEAFEDYQVFSESDDPDEQDLAKEIQGTIQGALQSVELPGSKNSGSCHFYGGGGDAVKHGDLDSSITNPNKALDVHMGTDGQDFNCTRCHSTVLHNVAGRIYSKPAAADRKSLIEDDLTSKITCESCHSHAPHKSDSKANDHTDKVACQSCHIPEFARVLPTKMWWDWSKAGKRKDGKAYKVKDDSGQVTYMSIKGDMRWEKDVQPEYFWFNGAVRTMTVKDTIDPGTIVPVTAPIGDPDDENARIFPFKVHRGKQPYDKIHKTFLAPMLSGKYGYFKNMDWEMALTRGQAAFDLPYSGEFDFVETSYVFPTTHMVAPKGNVVGCAECHTGQDGRLSGVPGVYMPARDGAGPIDPLGWILVFGSLAGVVLHGLGRLFTNGRRGE